MNYKRAHKVLLIGVLGTVVLIVIGYYLFVVRNPLPSDEEMVKIFNIHRSDIEELVKRYRIFNPDRKVDHSTAWYKDSETQEIMRRVGLDRISFSSFSPWPPKPYSLETARFMAEQSKVAKDYRLFIEYGSLIVKLLPRQRYRSYNLKYSNIWKDFEFIPQIPRIENGELLWPLRPDGKYAARRRVVSTLDSFPENWKPFECVYKQIEPNWFLTMCNGH